MSRYDFLWAEALRDEAYLVTSPYHVYRAVRAIFRLQQEGELMLSLAEERLVRRLADRLVVFHTKDSASPMPESLSLVSARAFLSGFRELHQDPGL